MEFIFFVVIMMLIECRITYLGKAQRSYELYQNVLYSIMPMCICCTYLTFIIPKRLLYRYTEKNLTIY